MSFITKVEQQVGGIAGILTTGRLEGRRCFVQRKSWIQGLSCYGVLTRDTPVLPENMGGREKVSVPSGGGAGRSDSGYCSLNPRQP